MAGKDNLMLSSLSHFIKLNHSLGLIKDDIDDLISGYTFINILDYHVVYQFGVSGATTSAAANIKYAFEDNVTLNDDEKTLSVLLPYSYVEMKWTWGKVKKCLSTINMADIEILRKDCLAREFQKSMKDYVRLVSDSQTALGDYFGLTRKISKNFRVAFLTNPDESVRQAFKKILKFYYAENLFINPYKKILSSLNNSNYIKLAGILKEQKLYNLKYEEEIYKSAMRELNNLRGLYRSNVVDASCYATARYLQKKLQECRVRFFTSPAVYDAFSVLQGGLLDPDTVVRNTYLMALEKYIMYKNNQDHQKAKKYIDYWREIITNLVELSDEEYIERSRIRTLIRNEFMFNFLKMRKKVLKKERVDPLYDLLNNPEPIDYMQDTETVYDKIQTIEATLSWMETLDSEMLQKKKNKLASEYKAIFDLLYEAISSNEFLQNHVTKAEDDMNDCIKENTNSYHEEELELLEKEIQQLITTKIDNVDRTDAKGRIKNLIVNEENKHKLEAIIKRFYNEAKEKDLLNLAKELKDIAEHKDLHIK